MRNCKLCLVSLLLFLWLPLANSSDRVKIDIFFESLDGQAWQWYFLTDAVKKRLPQVDIRISCLVGKNASGVFESKRGEREVQESIKIAVIDKLYPSQFFNYLNARSLNPWPDGWKDAAIFAGISPQKIEQAVKEKGLAVLNEHYERSKKLSITNTSVLINGKPYPGEARLVNLLEAVNLELPKEKRLQLPKPDVQSSGPLPKFIVAVSSRHHIQQDNNILAFFSKNFDGLKPELMEYETGRAAKLPEQRASGGTASLRPQVSEALTTTSPGAESAAKLPEIDFIPAYLIEDTSPVRETFRDMINSGMFSAKDGFLIYYDKNSRNGVFVKRREEPDNLKLFVMSQCPYGVQAEHSIIEAVRNKLISDKINVSIHFIADINTGSDGKLSFRSLHGTPEWEENVRQLIISKKFPEKFFDYLLERNKDVTSSQWEIPAKKAKISPQAVINEFEEGKKLLTEDIKLANELRITTSPTFLLNGNVLIVGINELMKVKGFEKLPAKSNSPGACK